jgi:hypothetical protein
LDVVFGQEDLGYGLFEVLEKLVPQGDEATLTDCSERLPLLVAK